MGKPSEKIVETVKKDKEQKRALNGQFISDTEIALEDYSLEDLAEDSEYDVCKEFGCGHKLTHQEKLYSDRCFIHNKINTTAMDNNIEQLMRELRECHAARQALMNKYVECNRINEQYRELFEKILEADFNKIGMIQKIRADIRSILDSYIA